MKKNFLSLIFVFLFQSIAFSQCEFSYSELTKLLFVNDSNFETAVLKKGFEYMQENKSYVCISENNPNMIVRTNEYDRLTLGFNTYSKSSYISIKEEVIKAGFKYVKSDNKDDISMHVYEAKDMMIIFATQKIDDDVYYLISIQIFKQTK